MTQPRKDDWHKPRNQGQHLSDNDIATMRKCYDAGVAAADAARRLQCSSRIAYKYYALFRNGTPPVIVKRFRAETPHHHYKNNVGR